VAAGRIACYGVSSNTAVSRPDEPEATSLSAMLEAAEAAGGSGHHFQVLQLPLNLFEAGALLTANTGPGTRLTPLALAAERGIAVLANRPLNAFMDGRLIRLADFPASGEAAGDPDESLRRLAALEAEFRTVIAPRISTQGGPPPAEWFRWADQLGSGLAMQGIEEWEEIESRMVTPAVAQMVLALDQGLQGPVAESWAAWRDRYLPELDGLLEAIAARALRRSQGQSDRVSRALAPHLPPARAGEPLSRKALSVLLSTPGLTAALLGMRRPEYVQDALEVLAWPPLPDPRAAYEAVQPRRRE
jgi:aryl-alcohol dehydrogenase-like predicted oxidoreductase